MPPPTARGRDRDERRHPADLRPADEPALRRLAGRDSARPLEGRVLLAEIDGSALAAICLETRRVVADPFSPTAALVDLLHSRADQLARASDRPARPGGPALRRARAWLSHPARETAS